MQLIIKGKFDFEGDEWENISNSAKNLIRSMIIDVQNRIKMEDVFKSEWVRSYIQKERDVIGKDRTLQIFNKNKL